MCERLLEIGKEGIESVEYAVDISSSFYKSNCLTCLVKSFDGNIVINSITRFEDLVTGPIQVPNPSVVRYKGCGRGGRPPKSLIRFSNTREFHVQRKISANSRKCRESGQICYHR